MKDDKINHFDKLWVDYIELSENYRDNLSVPQFGAAIITFASRMLFDCAPSHEQAVDLIDKAVCDGHDWSNKEKGNE